MILRPCTVISRPILGATLSYVFKTARRSKVHFFRISFCYSGNVDKSRSFQAPTNGRSSSWLDRIPFALLFGVATSVELFQARLLKSTCAHLYGDQFDVEQSAIVMEKIFKTSVAHAAAPLRLGPSLLQTLLDRQQDQVAGLSMFISSLKVCGT